MAMGDAKSILNSLGGRKTLIEPEVKSILKGYGIAVPDYHLVKTEGELEDLKLHFPVAAKVSSPEILHKTDVGGVMLGLNDERELRDAFRELKKKFPDADVMVEPMEKGNAELIMGLLNDPTFGITIMFGMGGIFAEVYKDVVFRVVPIERADAEDMLKEIKARKLLEGFRNIKTDREAVVDTLLKLSKLGEDLEDRLDQMDLNPVFVKEHGVVVVDAKMLLR
jgi:acyl-CoA synthetase (NDP forming)